MSVVGAITLYAARDSVVEFDDLIALDGLEGAETKNFSGEDEDGREWSARLYLWPGELRPPPWLAFVRKGFGNDLTVPDTAQSRAVVAIKVFFRRERLFALTSGAGRFQLRRGATDPGWGLRTALNSIYVSDEGGTTTDRIRQVETRTVAASTFRTLRQASRAADFDTFGYDIEADQLNAIVGRPDQGGGLGSQVKGGVSLRLSRRSTFDELGSLCRRVASLHEKKSYQRRFGFVDDIRQVTSATLILTLTDLLLDSLGNSRERWQLAPPG